MDEEQEKKVYSEVYSVLKGISKTKVMKIPKKELETILNRRNKSYELSLDWNKPLEDQNLMEDTINMLAYIEYNYWIDEEEKEKFKEILKTNKQKMSEQINQNNTKRYLMKKEGSFRKIINQIKKFLHL